MITIKKNGFKVTKCPASLSEEPKVEDYTLLFTGRKKRFTGDNVKKINYQPAAEILDR